jgi:hypothetical protein
MNITAACCQQQIRYVLVNSFLRTHQSHLVNVKYVSNWIKEDGGMLLLEVALKYRYTSQTRKRERLVFQAYSFSNELFTNIISNCYWSVYFTLTRRPPGFLHLRA